MLIASLLAIVFTATSASAHPLAPAVLDVRADATGVLSVRWRVALPLPRGARVEPLLPNRCRALEAPVPEETPTALTTTWRADCGGPITGDQVGVTGLRAPLTAIVRVALADGRVAEAVLTEDRPVFRVPETPDRRTVFRDYLLLGAHHIATGPDHLLFVFGLVLLAATWRRVLATVTAFTIGHSITLALSVLGLVSLPSGPIELAIALSVLVVAIEVIETEGAESHAPTRRPWWLAGAFGLLHGLGFASVLTEAGLPATALPLALLAFNLGIEAGQVAFVLAVVSMGRVLWPLAERLPAWSWRLPGYAMGTIASYWCFERAAAWLGG